MPSVSRGLFRWLFQGGARLEDFADRLNHVWTFGLLLVLGAVISWKQGFNDPISCWCPREFPASMVQYTNQHCWNSYYIAYPENVKNMVLYKGSLPTVMQEVRNEEDKEELITTYYQWVPVILCLQALLFKLPNIILYVFHGFSGIDFDKISGLTAGYQYLNMEGRQNLANQMARYIYRWCKMFPRGLPWRVLTAILLLAKLMYCINVIIQMAYIDQFLRTTNEPYDNSTSYGDVIYGNIAMNNGTTWKVSPVFPPQVMCQFNIRQLTNVQSYIVQCNLNANPFTERAYMFLWVWFLFVAVVTPLSLVVWVLKTLLPLLRQRKRKTKTQTRLRGCAGWSASLLFACNSQIFLLLCPSVVHEEATNACWSQACNCKKDSDWRKRYVSRFLALGEDAEDRNTAVNQHYADQVASAIGEDGVMVLKLIGANSSELLVRDIVCRISKLEGKGPIPTSKGQGMLLQSPPPAQTVTGEKEEP